MGSFERPHLDVRDSPFKACVAVTGTHPLTPLDIFEATHLLPPPDSVLSTANLIAQRRSPAETPRRSGRNQIQTGLFIIGDISAQHQLRHYRHSLPTSSVPKVLGSQHSARKKEKCYALLATRLRRASERRSAVHGICRCNAGAGGEPRVFLARIENRRDRTFR